MNDRLYDYYVLEVGPAVDVAACHDAGCGWQFEAAGNTS